MRSKALLLIILTKALQVANVDRFRYSFVMTYGVLITHGFEGKCAPKYPYLQKQSEWQMLVGLGIVL